jgi:hypothetical protein
MYEQVTLEPDICSTASTSVNAILHTMHHSENKCADNLQTNHDYIRQPFSYGLELSGCNSVWRLL